MYFIPLSRREDVAAIEGREGRRHTYAYIDPNSRAIIVFVRSEDGEADLKSARDLDHELAHAYGANFVRFNVIKGEDGTEIELTAQQTGILLGIKGEEGKISGFFEEYYAVQKELDGSETRARFFPEEAAESETIMHALIERGAVSSEDAPYVSIYEMDGEKYCGFCAYMTAHRVGSFCIQEIPGGMEAFRKARVSRHWGDFSRKVNERFGQGTFKMISHIDPENDEECELLLRYLKASDDHEKEEIKRELVAKIERNQAAMISSQES